MIHIFFLKGLKKKILKIKIIKKKIRFLATTSLNYNRPCTNNCKSNMLLDKRVCRERLSNLRNIFQQHLNPTIFFLGGGGDLVFISENYTFIFNILTLCQWQGTPPRSHQRWYWQIWHHHWKRHRCTKHHTHQTTEVFWVFPLVLIMILGLGELLVFKVHSQRFKVMINRVRKSQITCYEITVILLQFKD